MKKGIYDIVTTFFFVIISLITVLGVVFFTDTVSIVEMNIQGQSEKFNLARNFRESVLYCFGTNVKETYLDQNLCIQSTNVTNITFRILNNDIKGYEIEKSSLNNCTNKTWEYPDLNSIRGRYKNIFVYSIPIMTNESKICHSKLSVYI